MNIEPITFINNYMKYCLNINKIIKNYSKLEYQNIDFKIYYKYLPYLTFLLHFILINYLLKNVKKTIIKECKQTINYYFTNKIRCYTYHIKNRKNVSRKTPSQYKVNNAEKIINEISFINFEEFYEYQYPIIKDFYEDFTDEQICNYALTLFDSKFALIKEH